MLQMNSFSLQWALQSLIMTEMSFRHHKKSTQKAFKPHTRLIYHKDNLLDVHTTIIVGPAALVVAEKWPMVRISHLYQLPTGQMTHNQATLGMKSLNRQLTIHLNSPISTNISTISSTSITTNTLRAIWIILTNCLRNHTQDTTHRMLTRLINLFLPPHTITDTIPTLISIRLPTSTRNTIHPCHVYKRQSLLIQTLNLSKIMKTSLISADHQQRPIENQKPEKQQ